jgi:hypothetical protein
MNVPQSKLMSFLNALKIFMVFNCCGLNQFQSIRLSLVLFPLGWRVFSKSVQQPSHS